MPRAIVVGAGIGGLAAAIALERAGVGPLVVERAATLREAGFGLVLQPNAVAALDRLGLRDEIAARGRLVDTAEIRNPRGDLISTLPFTALGAETYGILRSELQQTLLEAVPSKRLRLGAACEGVELDGRVRLAGEVLRAEAVVGADGIRSVVRASLHGEQPLRYAGYRSRGRPARVRAQPHEARACRRPGLATGGPRRRGTHGDGRADPRRARDSASRPRRRRALAPPRQRLS